MPQELAADAAGGFMAPTRSSQLHHQRDVQFERRAAELMPSFGALTPYAGWRPVRAADTPFAQVHHHSSSADTQRALQWNLPARPPQQQQQQKSQPAFVASAEAARANPLSSMAFAEREAALARKINAAVLGVGLEPQRLGAHQHQKRQQQRDSAEASPVGSDSEAATGFATSRTTSRSASRSSSRPASAVPSTSRSRPASASVSGNALAAQVQAAQQQLATTAASNGALFRSAGLPSRPSNSAAATETAPRPATARSPTYFAPPTPPAAMVDPRLLAPCSRDAATGLSLRIGTFTPAAPLDPNDSALAMFRNNVFSTDAAFYQGMARRAKGMKPLGGLDAEQIDPAFRSGTVSNGSSRPSSAWGPSSERQRFDEILDDQPPLYSSFSPDGIFHGDDARAVRSTSSSSARGSRPALYRAKESIPVPRGDGSFEHALVVTGARDEQGNELRQPKLFLQRLMRPNSAGSAAKAKAKRLSLALGEAAGGANGADDDDDDASESGRRAGSAGGGDEGVPPLPPKDDMRVTASIRTVAEQARRDEQRMLKQYRTVVDTEERKRERIAKALKKNKHAVAFTPRDFAPFGGTTRELESTHHLQPQPLPAESR